MEKLIKTELIEKYIEDNNLSKAEFCRQCNISPSTLIRMLNHENFFLNGLLKVSKVIKVPFYKMFN